MAGGLSALTQSRSQPPSMVSKKYDFSSVRNFCASFVPKVTNFCRILICFIASCVCMVVEFVQDSEIGVREFVKLETKSRFTNESN